MYNQGRGLIIRSKPFNHPAVILILREVFFGSMRKLLAEQYRDCFASTIETLSDEAEIPAAALALVATCVCFFTTLDYDSDNILFYSCLFQIHSAIDDYSSGVCKKTDFGADCYKDVYKSHIEFLENIKTASATKYHRLMAGLYTNALYVIVYTLFALLTIVFRAVTIRRTTVIADNAMTLLDSDNMEE